ncbi:MAG: rod shape-determining protein MreC [Alphaproteobacteria bacterium]|nr:rod shape-determining protein MreC [Alphaproteobacteria bacterium]
MKQPAGQLSRLGTFRSLIQRFAFLALITTAVGLMLLGKADTLMAERLREVVADAFAPILDVLSRPAASIADLMENIRGLAALRAQNAELLEKNERLAQWQAVARQLEAENDGLRSLLHFVPSPQASFISARVIAVVHDAFVRNLLINAGTHDGVRKGQAVVTGDGVVGRVDEVGSRASRILLITDLNSRIPVIIEPSRTRAILVGNGAEQPRLMFLAGNAAKIAPGNRVVTAADANAFPPDLPVGVVSKIIEGKGVFVETFVNIAQTEYVRMVDYGLTGILPSLVGDGEGQ